MPEDTQLFEVAIVFNGNHNLPPRIVIFKGTTGGEARKKATDHLQENTTFRPQEGNMWSGPDGEAVITPFINKMEC